MGSFAGQALDKMVADAPSLFRSMEHIASETEAGKLWVDTLKYKVEPLIGKETTANVQAGLSGEEAMSKARQTVKKQAFGKNNTLMMGILEAVEKQKGTIAANTLANAHNIYWAEDALKGSTWRSAAARDIKDAQGNIIKPGIKINPNSAYSGRSNFENGAKELSRTLNLSLISIPHALQAPLNGLAIAGYKNTYRVLSDLMTDYASARALALKAGALGQELAYAQIAAQNRTSKFALLLDPMRKAFSMERRMGMAYSSVISKHAVTEAAETFFKSGGQDKAAKLQIELFLGRGSSNKIMHQGGVLTQDDIELAAFRGSSEIMGYKSPLETPMVWDKNSVMRIASTYKQYGFRAMRLHQQVLQRAYQGEGIPGVIKKLVTYGSVFFLAGELIKGAEGAATLRNPWSEENRKNNLMHNEYIDALAAGMGFNLLYAATRSATSHKLANFIAGPIISTGTDLAQDVWNIIGASKTAKKTAGANRVAATRQLAKDVVRRAGLPGKILTPKLFPPKKKSTY